MTDDDNNSQNSQPTSEPSKSEPERAIAKAFMVSMSWAMAGLFDKPKSEKGDREPKD